MTVVQPGGWLGLLGGGQLGRMFSMAAQHMGYRVLVIDPGSDSPAGSVADAHLQADYLDEAALDRMGRSCGAATTEFENVPADSLARLAALCQVSPDADSVAIAQDRIREKTFLQAQVGVAPFKVVERAEDLDASIESRLLPGILKRARLGYDGKGQARVATRAEAQAAFAAMGALPCVLEKRMALELELSVVVARGRDGRVACFPVAENRHSDGILDVTIVPARVPAPLAQAARDAAIAVAQALRYVGVLCVEFFVVDGGQLVANEIAPRPHNSGHYSIDACVTSQFEQQVRVMAGLPLGDPALLSPACMVNLLGDLWAAGTPDWARLLSRPRAKLHLYGKKEPRAGRKMGHYTCLADSADAALAEALAIRAELARAAQPDPQPA